MSSLLLYLIGFFTMLMFGMLENTIIKQVISILIAAHYIKLVVWKYHTLMFYVEKIDE